ncbi:MAG TPA: MDR family oxidoreductase, partial [Burkholderiaceae bacterium]|nr:MDR family oxidoreductase [Burkholderiaceae bacterium]
MPTQSFCALFLDNRPAGGFSASVQRLSMSQLFDATPGAEVLIAVSFSSLNYKDALALTNQSPVVRQWPMVAGIDAVGRVLASSNERWRVGDAVIANGWGLGELHWGGLSQRLRAQAAWLVALPVGFSERQVMAVGTAGYTAALCVMALERAGIQPASGPVLVTGASGGVGSVAVALLAARGFEVTACTGKSQAHDYLGQLGAHAVIDRSALSAPGKPLQKERWAGAIDTAGGDTLANVCAQLHRGGVVAACGLAQAMALHTTLAPFILRGVSLWGIDSAQASAQQREQAWALLATCLDRSRLD